VRHRLLILFAAVALASCAAPPTRTEAQLLGEWRYADSSQLCQYSFSADGTFRGYVSVQHRRVSEFTGRWAVRDNLLLYEYTGDALGKIPAGSRDQDRLLAVAADHFEIQAADGSRRRYERIK
jgi:hypothetical protein